ncbi:MAG: protein translocase subunit SecF [Acidimicrobiales bacterium]
MSAAAVTAKSVQRKRGPWSRLYRGETAVDFVGRRRRWFAISAIVIIAGMTALGIRGLNFGIDFKGGTSWQVPSHGVTVSQARTALGSLGTSATIAELGNGHNQTLQVQTQLSGTAASQTAAQDSVTKTLALLTHVNQSVVTVNSVGPSWGGQVTNKAVRAVIIFFIAIALYITIRFEWKMALSAVVAVLHDLVVTVGIYALVGFPVTPDTVVAVLTILGYSLYDTIVVFDRVKENAKGIGTSGKLTYSDTVNLSMNQVLMRSLNTSVVAILPILSILVIGAEVLGATTLQEFGLALVIGLTSGVYSSIFIASPLLAILKERETRYRTIRSRLVARGQGPLVMTPAAMLALVGGSSRSAPGSARNAGIQAKGALGSGGLPRLTPRQRARIASEAPRPGPQAPSEAPQAGSSTAAPRATAPEPPAPRATAPEPPAPRATAPDAATDQSTAPPRLRPSRARSPKAANPPASTPPASAPSASPPAKPGQPGAPRKPPVRTKSAKRR